MVVWREPRWGGGHVATGGQLYSVSKVEGFFFLWLKDVMNHILQRLVSVKYNIQSSSAFCGHETITDQFTGYYFPSFSRILLDLFFETSFLEFH